MEIDQLTVTTISLTLRTKAFLYESDDVVPLDTPIIVFLDSVTILVSTYAKKSPSFIYLR